MWQELMHMVFAWLPYDPENTQAFEFLGKAAHALGDKELALRAFSSIAEVSEFNVQRSPTQPNNTKHTPNTQHLWATIRFTESISFHP